MDSFYQQIYKECEKFLGNKTREFLNRQIEGHLNIKPEDIQPADKETLMKWLKISVSLYKGREKSDELMKRLKGV